MIFFWKLILNAALLHYPVIAFFDDEGPSRGYNRVGKYITSGEFQKDITVDGLMGNLAELESIAEANGGNRAFGYPGYDASLEFVRSKLEKFSNTSTLWTQNFTSLFNKVESISFKANGASYFVYGLGYSPSTSPEGISAELALGPTGDVGCMVEGYDGYDVKNKIVLVERGACETGGTLAGRLRPAAASGAAAVIIYNNVPSHITYGTLTAPDPDSFVPGGFIDQTDGWYLRDLILSGESVQAYFQQTQLIEDRVSQNILAETNSGDPNNVIMLGAHLDSVLAGPGINDDGSGTSLILELFIALQKYDVKNKIRFAWWGAEENGMAGSKHYTSSLDATSASQILVYLNFDMVSQGYYGVFDGDGSTHGLPGPPGSVVIERLFVDDLTSKGIEVTPVALNRGSDYASFMDILGKPVGGLHTGSGIEQDPCYHQACDTYNNINSTILTVNAKTTAHVLSTLAMTEETFIFKSELKEFPKRRPVTTNSTEPRLTSFLGGDFPVEGHLSNCGHFD